MSTFSYELVLAWMVAVETRTQTDLLGWFFLLKQPINTPKTYLKKLATRGIANVLGWVQLCHKFYTSIKLKPPLTPRKYRTVRHWEWKWVGMVEWNGHFSIRPVQPGKVVHLKRRISFFETFPVGPSRSIEFWTKISGNFGWMDRAQ